MTTPQPLQQAIDEKNEEINTMRIVVAVLAVVVLFLLIILAYCTCVKRIFQEESRDRHPRDDVQIFERMTELKNKGRYRRKKKSRSNKDVEMSKTPHDNADGYNNKKTIEDNNYNEIRETDDHNNKKDIPFVKVTQDVQTTSSPDADSLYEAMTEASTPRISSTKRATEPDKIDVEAMRRLSRSNSMSLIGSRSRATTPTIEGAIAKGEFYEMVGEFAQNQKPVTKSLSMPPARRQEPRECKEPIYSEVNTYDRSLSVPTPKHQRSCSLDGRQSVCLPKEAMEKKRMSLPPPTKPPRRSSLKSNISNESGGGIIYSRAYESTNSLRSLDSYEGELIGVSSRQVIKKQAPPKPLRTSTENLYCVPKKFDRSQSQKQIRTDDRSQLILNMEKQQPIRSKSEKPIRAMRDSPPIIVQNYENFGFDKESNSVMSHHNNNLTAKKHHHPQDITEIMDNQYIIQTSYDGLDYYGDNEVYTRMDGGGVEEQNVKGESTVYEIVYR